MEPEGKTTLEEMAKQIEADLAEPEESAQDNIDSPYYYRDGKVIDETIEKCADPNMDALVAFFKLKKCIHRDLDLIVMNYWDDFNIIPALHKALERILWNNPKEWAAVDSKYQVMKAFLAHDKPEPAGALFDFYWSKILQGAFTKEELLENITRNFMAEYHHIITGIPTKKANIEYEMNNTGIIKRSTIYNENDPDNPTITEARIWDWRDFRLVQVLKDVGDTQTIYRFNFKYNNDFFMDKNLVEMRDHVFDGSCKSTGKDKQIFGPLIMKYVESGDVPIQSYSGICGFTKDGWRMPDQFYIKFTPLQAKARACIYEMCKMKVTESEAQDMMKTLYNAVSLRHKDLIFAHMMVMPILHALRDTTDLIYWVALGSAPGNTGKTPAGVLMTTKIWNNMNRPFITKDQASTEARMGEYLSASTFGLLIDDCGDLPEEVTNTIKSYITGEAGYTRLNVDHTARIDKDYTSPIVLAFNKNPPIFNDTAFLSRGMYIPVLEKPTAAQIKTFKEAWRIVPKGYLGRYIYEKLKDKDLEYFISSFEFMNDWVGAPSGRANVIYKGFQLGAFLFKQIFGITLDVSEVPNLIKKTLELGSDDIFTIILNQIEDATVEEDFKMNPENENTKADNSFKPRRKWITAPVIYKHSRKFDGYIYTADNLADLNNRLRMKNPMDMPGLCEVLLKRWEGIIYTTAKIQEKAFKCIYIPKKAILKEDPDDPDVIAEKELQEKLTAPKKKQWEIEFEREEINAKGDKM